MAELKEFDKDHKSVGGDAVHRDKFAYVGDPEDKSTWHLPLDTAARAEDALGRFAQTEGIPADKKAEVARKVAAAAKSHGVNTEGFESKHLSERTLFDELHPEVLEVSLSEIKDGLVRIPLCYTGQKFKKGNQEFTISLSDLRNMDAQLNEREIMIDYEHLSAQPIVPPGFGKAAGWVKRSAGIEKLSDGRHLLWGWAEFTAAMLTAIKNKEYRYTSAEPHWNERDEKGRNIGTVVAAVAMVNRPFQKDLPPIEISPAVYPQLLETVSMSELTRRSAMVDIGSVHVDSDINDPTKEKTKMADETMKTLSKKKVEEGEHKGKFGYFSEDGKMVGMAEDNGSGPVPFKMKHMKDGPHKGKVGLFDGDVMMGHVTKSAMKACMDDIDDTDDADDADGSKKAAKMKAARLADERAKDAICLVMMSEAKPSEIDDMIDGFIDKDELSTAGSRRAQKIDRLLTSAFAKGKFAPTQRTALFTWAVTDYDSCSAFLSEQKATVDLKSRGIEGNTEKDTNPTGELLGATRAYMADHKITDFAAAMTAFTQTETGKHLYELHREAVLNVKQSVPVGAE